MTTEQRLEKLARELTESDFDYVATVEAQRFVEREAADHSRAFVNWLRDNAVSFTSGRLTHYLRNGRNCALQRRGSRTFARAAGAIQAGDPDATTLFSVAFVVDDENTRRPLGKMVAADCSFVANAYEAKGNRHLMLAAFLRALGQQAGTKPVSSVMNEAEAEALLHSITGSDELAIAA